MPLNDLALLIYLRLKSWLERNEETVQGCFDEGSHMLIEHLPHIIGTFGR